MKKVICKLFFVLVFLPVFISCDDVVEGEAIISFDSSSTYKIPDEGTLTVTGTVKTTHSMPIENITAMCLYKSYNYDLILGKFIIADSTRFIADFHSPEFRRINDYEYEFLITEKNTAILEARTTMFGIRLNVRTSDKKRTSKTWAVRPQYKI